MNPYLEQPSCWESLHNQLCGQIAQALVPQLRPNYLVKLEHRLYIHEKSAEERRYFARSDVGVATPQPRGATAEATSGLHVAAPAYAVVPAAVEVEKQAYVEILDRDHHQVVTAIEILSPTNKRIGEDREQYLIKRRSMFYSLANLVEIDLLRGDLRMPADPMPDCDYCVLVSRTYERPRIGIWSWKLRDAIPEIPIPVRPGDADAKLDLKPLIEQVHDALGFADYIYTGLPEPRLPPDEQDWVNERLRGDPNFVIELA